MKNGKKLEGESGGPTIEGNITKIFLNLFSLSFLLSIVSALLRLGFQVPSICKMSKY